MENEKKTFRISENKLRHLIKESIHEVLQETSYDLARKAYEKAVDTSYDPKTLYSIPEKEKRAKNIFGHLKDRASQNVNMDMDVIVVGGDKEGLYKVKDLANNFEITGYEEPSENPRYNNSPLVGMPHLKGLIGPMLDGNRVRYETQEAYDFFSK
jgi:hypothetical protein